MRTVQDPAHAQQTGAVAAAPVVANASYGRQPEPATAKGARLATIFASHTVNDVYSVFVPALLGLLEVRCGLTLQQSATLLGIGSITSGVAQPLAAWYCDRFDSRLTGGLGLAVCAVCLCSIGMVSQYWQLLVLFGVGMFAGGTFHPPAAATSGELAGYRRGLGMSCFFVAGMMGMIIGSFAAPRIAALPDGFGLLRYCMVPGVLLAVALHLAIRHVPHRQPGHDQIDFAPGEVPARWLMVMLLFVASAIRFSVYMALVYLCVRYVQGLTSAAHGDWTSAQVATFAAPTVGNLNAALVGGMAIGGLVAGFVVRAGREKWPMVLVPIICCPAIHLLPHGGIRLAYLMAVVAGFGFASMVPVSMAVAQRLLPHRTSMASALMLGGAWSLAFAGPKLAGWGVEHIGLMATYSWAAVALAVSGLCVVPLRSALIRA